MRIRQKKASHIIFLWIAIPLLSYLCYIQINRTEVGDTHFAEILCIDWDDTAYTVTALYDNASSKNNDGLTLIDGTGNSVYSAFTNLSRKNSKDISLDHTAYFMISQKAAYHGLDGCLDFISREPDMKTNAKIFIVQSNDANDLLKTAMEEDDFAPSETLNAISAKQTNNLKKPMNTLLHVLNDMDHSYNNLLIPYLVYEDTNMYLEGYAAFKNQHLYSFLDYEMSQAIDLFRNNLRTCPLNLTNNLSVDLTDIEVNPQLSLTNNVLQINMKVKMDSNLTEAPDTISVFNQDSLNRINELEKLKLMDNLIEVMLLMKQENLDLLNIGPELEKQVTETQLNENWETYVKNLDISLSVKSTTAKTYTIETK